VIRRIADRAARVVRHLAHRATAPFLIPPPSSLDSLFTDLGILPRNHAIVDEHSQFGFDDDYDIKAHAEERARHDSDDPGVDVDIPRPSHDTLECAGRERGWMQTVTGRRFYPLAPRAEDVDIYDIAHGLAMCCRYAGHTRHFYSVAEHCVHVSREVERALRERVDGRAHPSNLTVLRWSLLALLHDSAEAYIGDMIRPLKHQPEMAEFRRAEAAIERAVHDALIPFNPAGDGWARLIKEIDDRIIVDEIELLKADPSMYDVAPVGGALGVRLECWGPEWARERFLLRYEGLKAAIELANNAE
jgi:uncharacterized protein